MSSQSDQGNVESPAKALASFVTETMFDDVPTTARDAAVRAITDTVGVTLAGLSHESAGIVGAFTGRDSLVGFPRAADVGGARAELALLYGTAAHALDYDDLSWAMDGHPSVVLLPPILALADRVEPTGREVLTAYAVGFETACFVAEPISPDHYEAGWHATSTFGALGATAAATSLLDLDADATKTALNIAASTASGTKENFGSMTKPLHAGLAARSGVTAALLAEEGFTAGSHAIDGDRGFWTLYAGDADRDAEAPTRPTSDGWRLADRGIHVKRYPACYFTHSSIAATRTLVDDGDVEPDRVEHVQVEAAGGAGDALTYPDPETALESKFSMQHAVAVALTADHVGLSWFDTGVVDDPTLADLRDRVTFTVDDSLPYDSHAATVTVKTSEETRRAVREHPPWVHDEPPTRDELESKFVESATQTVDESAARETFERLQALEEQDFETSLSAIRL
jgi:2-methylcitrate dehydratase PrpD